MNSEVNGRELVSKLPTALIELCTTLGSKGYGAWIVGGCVRDLLMGRSVEDWDVATTALPDQVARVFPRVVPTGLAHGTVTVLFKGNSYEVTTLRGEGGYSDGRRPDSVVFLTDINEDLARRDFTVNALALDPVDTRLIDPFGGLDDLRAKLIRAVGDPLERFGEDGLRVLRAARFVATLDFALDPRTHEAIEPSLDTFRRVSKERVRDEWLKTMKAKKPSRAFEVMRETGVLAVICPELIEQVGCEQNRHHVFDVWNHTMAALDACEGSAVVRIATLLHDIGKPRSRALSEKTSDYTFYNHEVIGASLADEWLSTYRFSNSDRERIVRLIRHHLICYDDQWTDAAVRRFLRRVGTDLFHDLFQLAEADVRGKGRPVESELDALKRLATRASEELGRHAALRTRDLAIDGREVMKQLNLAPGPRVGLILEKLLEHVIDDPTLNTRDHLLALLPTVERD